MPAWNDLPKNQRLAILIAVPLLVAGTLGYFARKSVGKLGNDPALASVKFIIPKTKSNLYGEIAGLNKEIADAQVKIDKIDGLRTELEGLQSMIRVLREMLPSQVDKERMRRELEDIARLAEDRVGSPVILEGVWITIPGSGGRGGAQKQIQVTYSLTLKADMNALIWYINEIENHRDRFMVVTELTVSPGKITVDHKEQKVVPGQHSVNMTIATYVLAEGA